MGLFTSKKEFDFLAVGDTAIDAFIKIKDAEVNCDVDKKNCKLCFGFGDKTPYEYVEEAPAVGNAANASVSAARLGLRSALVSNLGADTDGEKCHQALLANKVDTDFVTIHKNKKTNYHYVLWFGNDRTILVKHNEYDYVLPEIGKTKWVYLSSLGENSIAYHKEIYSYLIKNPGVKLAFQPGTFQIKSGIDKLKAIYERTEIFFSNLDEAGKILRLPENRNVKDLADKIHRLGPKVVVITDGVRGAYAYDGYETYFLPPFPDAKPPVERTGAGDAFASTFVSALALGKPLYEAFMWGPINSMSVVQQVGAQRGLLTAPQIEELLKKAPPEYKPKKMI